MFNILSQITLKVKFLRNEKQHSLLPKRQALGYGILPSTTAVFSYAIGSRKLSANEQFFVGAQRVKQ